ncbi:hypothetical protein HK100_000650 [Physocladia obscura]|uniref:Methyltransferase domain-containing protein n=1 Tax=Physocladia obscura TaxID=109957 RepID=A0AAD5XJU4_9FUNG|nr:hypothetical protein HK100_000650 [Physocladia obscura]
MGAQISRLPKSANILETEQKTTATSDTCSISTNESVAKTWNPNSPSLPKQDQREYHAVETSSYVLPSDQTEQNRLRFQHIMLLHAFKQSVICPAAREVLKASGSKVLDVGCAQGFWLDDVSNEYPNAEYYGVDIAEDALAIADPKLTLTFGNVIEGLPYGDNTFDYVHQRLLVFGMPKDKYESSIAELIRVAKHDAWIELVEVDAVSYSVGPTNALFDKNFNLAMTQRGLDVYAGTNLIYYVKQVAQKTSKISHIKREVVSIPMNWGGSLGKAHALDIKAATLAVEDWLHRVMGVEREEYRRLLDIATEETGTYKSFKN